MRSSCAALIALVALCASPVRAQDSREAWYRAQPGTVTRWASPENPTAQKGAGGVENAGAKGRAYQTIPAGQALVLADVAGAGIIDRIWMTIDDRSPEMLRALRLDIYWDGASTPAVSVPLGDFFGAGAGALVPMDSALIASPEGRSFISYIPMPFRKRARMVVTNESARELAMLFYDVDMRKMGSVPADALYFHAHWSRTRATTPGVAFPILPPVKGHGRFLGSIVTVFADPRYGRSWFGEGEAKVYIDGDGATPTLVGTGTEDYIGTAWGQGAFVGRFQGSPVADEPHGRWTFYRFHVPDPILFDRDIRVDLQQIGGAPKADVIRMQGAGVPLRPITVDPGRRSDFRQLIAKPVDLTDPSVPDGWTNYYRSDDVSAVAYFYLDRPADGLPSLANVADRTAALRPPASDDKNPEAARK
ncbi:glycoside hydrolase family 172 protein [Sphingomonas crusticola]|uniref:glycoside hydrolase family 172 protein n=1 Tax=Sphingomonas crusticola TaxID=1697973 RepID=UPI000E226196|nr:glycoside hydrolase family 172 protein [Sphingomonas crusticola]